jgi:hypothetical protein
VGRPSGGVDQDRFAEIRDGRGDASTRRNQHVPLSTSPRTRFCAAWRFTVLV